MPDDLSAQPTPIPDGDGPTIARIREARRRISEEVGHDPNRLVERYIRLQQRHADRLVKKQLSTK